MPFAVSGGGAITAGCKTNGKICGLQTELYGKNTEEKRAEREP